MAQHLVVVAKTFFNSDISGKENTVEQFKQTVEQNKFFFGKQNASVLEAFGYSEAMGAGGVPSCYPEKISDVMKKMVKENGFGAVQKQQGNDVITSLLSLDILMRKELSKTFPVCKCTFGFFQELAKLKMKDDIMTNERDNFNLLLCRMFCGPEQARQFFTQKLGKYEIIKSSVQFLINYCVENSGNNVNLKQILETVDSEATLNKDELLECLQEMEIKPQLKHDKILK